MSKNINTTLEISLEENKEEVKTMSLLPRSLSKISNATYNTKKTMAQGLMDIALLTANANQLRYILEFRNERSANFVILLLLIACSLILQVNSKVMVGVMLIFKGRMDYNGITYNKINAAQLNNYVVLGVFLITIINIFIAAFTVAPT
ncbi:ninjurin-B-like isoform X1 [Daktulosphaira vitifoliae]|uniref:ninjurin-B-like isoform X1 n=1 Tax=Daktulosphaira vitifoliae TaxID=58002 RepID=UPI0021AAA92C|nr:ninjurin-B-like isoform X1 [Daktulosphaira vitifoliae]